MEKHNAYCDSGSALIMPYIVLADNSPKRVYAPHIKKGIQYLDAVTTMNSENWGAFWLKGKAYQALELDQQSYDNFKSAYDLQKENPDVAREFAFACMDLAKGDEAVAVASQALSVKPEDAGLTGNLALAYLIQGDVAQAEAYIRHALSLDATDEINRNLLVKILEVKRGERDIPQRVSDLDY